MKQTNRYIGVVKCSSIRSKRNRLSLGSSLERVRHLFYINVLFCMAQLHLTMDEAAQRYFVSLNFTCRNILNEKANFQSLLGDQWKTLPAEEQDSLLDEHFIPPHIKQKYVAQPDEELDLPEFYPRYKVKSGQKIIEDDEVSELIITMIITMSLYVRLKCVLSPPSLCSLYRSPPLPPSPLFLPPLFPPLSSLPPYLSSLPELYCVE